jgi:uncharacterized protein (TIGR00369 family)
VDRAKAAADAASVVVADAVGPAVARVVDAAARAVAPAVSVATIATASGLHVAARPRQPVPLAESLPAGVAARVHASFERQAFMRTVGARLVSVEPGQVVIEWPFSSSLTQQHGFLHAGVVTAVADSACGYAALSLMPEGVGVLSVEFKVNLMKPAAGELFRAVAKVIRAGRTLSVCSAEVHAHRAGEVTTIAVLQGTMMTVRDNAGLID